MLEELELEQPVVVTAGDLARIVDERGVATPAHVVAQRLKERGWLLGSGVRGVWEFAPASHAGPYPHGDPFVTLRAQLASRPDVPARVALGSALWLAGLADRAPACHEVGLPPRAPVPAGLSRAYRIVRFAPACQPDVRDGLPVDGLATLLVHAAHAPSQVSSWSMLLDALADLTDLVDPDVLAAEAAGRPAATRVRLAYLLEPVAPHLLDRVDAQAGGKVWFGPRGPLRRHDARWNVADTLLPHRPGTGSPA